MMKFARAAAWVILSSGVFVGCGCSNTVTSPPRGAERKSQAPAEQPSRATRNKSQPELGQEPPELTASEWLNIDGPQTLAGLRGQVVLVEFWATWCGPCRDGIPHMNELQAHYGEQGLRILSFTDESRAKVETFQLGAKSPIEYPIGVGSRLSQKYGVTSIPRAFIVDRDGKLRWEGHPAVSDCEKNIVAALQQEPRPERGNDRSQANNDSE
jgi:thiol-disulfide isomerase/thioredoxin